MSSDIETYLDECLRMADAASRYPTYQPPHNWHNRYHTDIPRLVAELRKTRAALEPFAKFHAEMKGRSRPFPQTGTFYALNSTEITVEDFKAAVEALEGNHE